MTTEKRCTIDTCDRPKATTPSGRHGSMCDPHQRMLGVIEHELWKRVGSTEGASDIVRRIAAIETVR